MRSKQKKTKPPKLKSAGSPFFNGTFDAEFIYTKDPNWDEERALEAMENTRFHRLYCSAWMHQEWENAWKFQDTEAFNHWTERILSVYIDPSRFQTQG